MSRRALVVNAKDGKTVVVGLAADSGGYGAPITCSSTQQMVSGGGELSVMLLGAAYGLLEPA